MRGRVSSRGLEAKAPEKAPSSVSIKHSSISTSSSSLRITYHETFIRFRQSLANVALALRIPIRECKELGLKSRQLRREHFTEVGKAVSMDDHGFPSMVGLMMDTQDMKKGGRPEMHPIEFFQRHDIFENKGSIIDRMKQDGLFWPFVLKEAGLLGGGCCQEEAVASGARTPTDDEFNAMFAQRWGAELLRPPEPGEDTFGVADAVVCDTWPGMRDADAWEQVWLEPCKVIFSQDETDGLRAQAIVALGRPGGPLVQGLPAAHIPPAEHVPAGAHGGGDLVETVHRAPDGSSPEQAAEWEWAKAMALGVAFVLHQLTTHLVHEHFVTEAFVALAYKHLASEHYVFRFLEPLCGDVGFINRTWGLEFIAGLMPPDGKAFVHPLTREVLPLTGAGVVEVVSRAQRLVTAEHYFWFDKDGYLSKGCGVKDSTDFPFRDACQAVYQATHDLVECIVDRFWTEDDQQLAQWWNALWFDKVASARRPLTQASLIDVLATIGFTATYRHEHSHHESIGHDPDYMHMRLRNGNKLKPETYLPTASCNLMARVAGIGLSHGSIETPLTCFEEAFPELPAAVKLYAQSVDDILDSSPGLKQFGTMTH